MTEPPQYKSLLKKHNSSIKALWIWKVVTSYQVTASNQSGAKRTFVSYFRSLRRPRSQHCMLKRVEKAERSRSIFVVSGRTDLATPVSLYKLNLASMPQCSTCSVLGEVRHFIMNFTHRVINARSACALTTHPLFFLWLRTKKPPLTEKGLQKLGHSN